MTSLKNLILLFLFLGFIAVNANAQNTAEDFRIKGKYLIRIKPSATAKAKTDALTEVRNLLGSSLKTAPTALVTEQQIMSWKSKFPAKAKKTADRAFERSKHIYQIELEEHTLSLKQLKKLEEREDILSIDPVYRYELAYEPNDPAVATGGFLRSAMETTMRFFGAWDIEKGSSDVVIGILDSGVNYNHEDLASKAWKNPLEAAGEAGIDDDGNGFIDDIYGWDFWSSGDFFSATQDNDPLIDREDHGTHVAGTAAAATDNGIGIVGTGFNARYMAVKMGGAPEAPRSINAIPQGLLYAGLNGADVINCSFSGPGGSAAVQDIVYDLVDAGVVVVAAAGNDGLPTIGFPAEYDGVLSVGWADSQSRMSSSSNYGFTLDVVAVGSSVYSATFENDAYTFKSGTSMASPMVAGLAALIKSAHPDWGARKIMAQIRSTGRNINRINLSERFVNRLGGGMIDAEKALGPLLPGVRLASNDFTSSNGGKLRLNEDGKLLVQLVNEGAASSNLSIRLEQDDDKWDLSNVADITGLSVAEGEVINLEFDITLRDNFSFQTEIPTIVLKVEDSSTDYDDAFVLSYDRLLYDIHEENEVVFSYGANGTVGFLNPFEGTGGRGFIPRFAIGQDWEELENQLFEGGLMMTIGDRVISSVRGASEPLRRDFEPQELIQFEQLAEDELVRSGTSLFRPELSRSTLIDIDMRSFSSTADSLKRSIIFEYKLFNRAGSTTYEDVRLGLFNDWDLPDYLENGILYFEEDSLQVVQTPGDDAVYAAVVHLGNIGSAFAINNDYQGFQDSLRFNLYDGYSDQEKIWSMKGGTTKTTNDVAQSDVAVVTASGPWTLGPGERASTAFAYIWAETIDEMRASARAARAWYAGYKDGSITSIEEEQVDSDLPTTYRLYNAYPNPFNPSTTIGFDLAESAQVQLEVFDLMGRKVATLVNANLNAGSYSRAFDASNLSSGLYIARMIIQSNSGLQFSESIKMQLIK